MVSTRITIFVLMFILLHVKDSSALTDQAMEKNLAAHVSGVEVAGRSSVKVEKEFYDGVPAASEVANTRVGGRKMMFDSALGKKMVKAQGLINGEDSKNSGMDINALKKQSGTSQNNLKDQDDLKEKLLNSGSMEISSKVSVDLVSSSQLCSQYSKLVSTRDSLECSSKSKIPKPQESAPPFQNVEPKKLLEAEKEIINLMDKDYGAGGHPRHTPPINNNQPLNPELP